MLQNKTCSLLSVLFIFFSIGNSIAQEVVTTEDGEKIILQEDGTWKTIDEDQKINTNNAECSFNILTKDQFTEEQWIVMESRSFLSDTKEQHEKFVKWDNFINADFYCIYIDERFGAYFRFEIASDSAREILGGLSGDNQLKIFTRGNPPIVTDFEDDGMTNEKDFQDVTIFRNNIRFTNNQVEVLLKDPVEKIGIEWNEKYLEYPVSDANIFKDQLKCIIQKI